MEETEEKPEKGKGGKKKLLLFALLGLLVLGGGGGAAAYFLGVFSPSESKESAEEMADDHAKADDGHGAKADHGHGKEPSSGEGGHQPFFIDIPDVVVNLTEDGPRMRFLKLRVSLEVADEPAALRVAGLMPRVLDSFQIYLRSLTVDELQGPSGLQRIKEELFARVNLAVQPNQIQDLLIKEMLVQ
ncbi:MAG: flagellar basal body-associated FliL family protein [Pseudomonadota bacterium]